MKKLFLIPILLLFTSLIITAQQKHALSVDDLWSMNRIMDFDISPSGDLIVFSTTKYSMEKNTGNTDIWLMKSDGTGLKVIKDSDENESQPKFTSDGSMISYIYKDQLWICKLDGSGAEKFAELYTGISGVKWFDDGSKTLFVSSVYPDCITQKCDKARDEKIKNNPVKAKILTSLFFRHWNKWRGDKRSHLFLFNSGSKKITDLTPNIKNDVPPIALESSNDYSFSPDGKEVAFTANETDYPERNTNNDIFIIDPAKPGSKKKISESQGNDSQPVYSPNGKYIAFGSMKQAGFESDKVRLMIYYRETGSLKSISDNIDLSVGEIIWSPDSKFIYFTSANKINESIFKINVETSELKIVIENRSNSAVKISPDGKTLYFLQQRSNLPNEIFSAGIDGKDLKQLTFVNKNILEQIEMNEIETFWSEGAAGSKVQSILVKPPFFDKSKKYPFIFLIHGGPQGHWTDEFHYRWNIQMFAAQGYVVVATNPRGSKGYGQKFTNEISQDWGGKVFTDLMNAYDYSLKNFSFIDSENTFAAGASYGGYMINWIEGHTDRFNALVCHDGVFNLESMYGGTEELWFPEWEFGGTPWENRQLYEKWSPHRYAENFKTPMLIVHGANDFRVPEGQAFELFTTLQRLGVESKLLYYPDEYHFVVKPLNAELWWKTVFDWFNKHKK